MSVRRRSRRPLALLGLSVATGACSAGRPIGPSVDASFRGPPDASTLDARIDVAADSPDALPEASPFDAAGEADARTCSAACTGACLGPACLMTLASGSAPLGIAVDSQSVYWVNGGDYGQANGTVTSVPLGGGAVVTLASGQDFPAYVAVDEAHAYWTNLRGGTVMQAGLHGESPVTLASSQIYPVGVAVDATSVYFTTAGEPGGATLGNDGTVMSVPIGGGPLVTIAGGLATPHGIVVDSANVYWTTEGDTTFDGTVMSAPLQAAQDAGLDSGMDAGTEAGTGTSVVLLALAQPSAATLAIDSSALYWSDLGAGTILALPIGADGGGVVVTLASGQVNAYGLAVDGASVYWSTSASGGSVLRVPLPSWGSASDGGAPGTPVVIATGQGYPQAIAVNATSLFWTSQPAVGTDAGASSVVSLTPK